MRTSVSLSAVIAGPIARKVSRSFCSHLEDRGFPQLGAQWADYVQAKLKDWKSGTSWGSDTNAQIMPTIAQKLSDEDIAALASYVEGLHAADAGTSTAKN